MKTYLNKVTSAAACVGLILVACVVASLGLSFMVILAMFALAIVGLGILATPLLALLQFSERKEVEAVAA
ncbi:MULTISPECIES: hypothetical protein [Ruegeria]|uniref:hypothetical protein n=1 Tax=Ruegeria TaxID=97050 RepID=UPI00147B037F|nr:MULTISPECIES: hypothetical protein [Ruegeria]